MKCTRVVLAVLLLCGGSAWAQGVGVLVGKVSDTTTQKALVDVVVTATSPAMQGEQLVVTDSSGYFRLPGLPPGMYTLRFEREAYRPLVHSDIRLRLDKTVQANVELLPEAIQAEQIVVVARAPTIDVGTSSTGLDANDQIINALALVPPGSRNSAQHSLESLAEMTPGARADDYGVAVSGTTSPENHFLIDGLTVNDPAFGLLGTPLSMRFVKEVNVLSGGYMPEYGNSTGAIMHVETKSGSNTLLGRVDGDFTPGLATGDRHVVLQDGSALTTRTELWNLGAVGAEVGGPLIKDKLWYFVGVETSATRYRVSQDFGRNVLDSDGNPVRTDADGNPVGPTDPGFNQTEPIPGVNSKHYFSDLRTLQYLAKLSYSPTANNKVHLSIWGAPTWSGGNNQIGMDPLSGLLERNPAFTLNGTTAALGHKMATNPFDVVANWALSSDDKRWLLDTTAGVHHQSREMLPTDGSQIGDLTGLASIPQKHKGAGGVSYALTDFFPIDPTLCTDASGNSLCPLNGSTGYFDGGPGFIDSFSANSFQGSIMLTRFAQLLGHHLVKAGVGGSYATLAHRRGMSGGTLMYEIGPDLYFDYPLFGSFTGPDQVTPMLNTTFNSSSKEMGAFIQDSWSILDEVTINAGLRYGYQALAGDDGKDAIVLPNQISPRVGLVYDPLKHFGKLAGRAKIYGNYGRYFETVPLDIIDRNFPGDRWVLGLTDGNGGRIPAFGWSGYNPNPGYISYQGGQRAVVDPDIKPQSSDEFVAGGEYEVLPDARLGFSFTYRKQNEVIEDMSVDEASSFFIGNPGYGMGKSMPKANRTYRGLTFYLSKSFSSHWMAQASYTYSQLFGNYSGLYRPETRQLDPNMTTDFDLASLTTNRSGALPGDMTHQLKLIGAGEVPVTNSFKINLGVGYSGRSGAPLNYLGRHPLYGDNEVFILPRGEAGRLPWVHSLDGRLAFTYKFQADTQATLLIDCFNIFNFQAAIAKDQSYTSADVKALQAGETLADLKRADGTAFDAGLINPNFGNPTAYQAPRTIRASLQVTY